MEASSASTGIDPNMMRRLAGTESSNNPAAKADRSSAQGLFQITDGTWADFVGRFPQLNLTDRLDPRQQARVAPYYMKEINENLTRKLGRAPNEAESKVGWLLRSSVTALVVGANPDTPIDRLVSPKALAANPELFSKARTVGQLTYCELTNRDGEAAVS